MEQPVNYMDDEYARPTWRECLAAAGLPLGLYGAACFAVGVGVTAAVWRIAA